LIEAEISTTSQESESHDLEAEEFDDHNTLFEAFEKVDLNQKISRKLTRGLYLKKVYVSDDDQ
jgi:hypothetical protein